jgi:hypothetical protein
MNKEWKMEFVEKITWGTIEIRTATEEEKEQYGWTQVLDCHLPNDGEKVLIITKNGTQIDTFHDDDDDCYFDSDIDWEDVIAWTRVRGYKMKEFNYLKEKSRMFNTLGRIGGVCLGVECSDCPLSCFNNRPAGKERVSCGTFEMECPEEATAVVRKWAEEHPRRTRKEMMVQNLNGLNVDN